MFLHSALEHMLSAALWIFRRWKAPRGSRNGMCSHKLLPHGTNVNNRKLKMRFSAATTPVVEWTKKQPHAIIRPEFLHMHKEKKPAWTTGANDMMWLKETGLSTYCLLSCVCFSVSAGMWWSFLPSEVKHKQARKSIPRATTSTESRHCVLSGTQHKDKQKYLDSAQQEREFNTNKGRIPLDVCVKHAPDQIGMHPQ